MFQFVSVSLDDILRAANVTYEEAMWALSAFQAGYEKSLIKNLFQWIAYSFSSLFILDVTT